MQRFCLRVSSLLVRQINFVLVLNVGNSCFIECGVFISEYSLLVVLFAVSNYSMSSCQQNKVSTWLRSAPTFSRYGRQKLIASSTQHCMRAFVRFVSMHFLSSVTRNNWCEPASFSAFNLFFFCHVFFFIIF